MPLSKKSSNFFGTCSRNAGIAGVRMWLMGALSIDGAVHIARPPPIARPRQICRRFLIDHRLDKTAPPRARICLDQIKPVVENIFFSRNGISRHGVISLGAGAPILLLGSAGDYATFKFKPLPRQYPMATRGVCKIFKASITLTHAAGDNRAPPASRRRPGLDSRRSWRNRLSDR